MARVYRSEYATVELMLHPIVGGRESPPIVDLLIENPDDKTTLRMTGHFVSQNEQGAFRQGDREIVDLIHAWKQSLRTREDEQRLALVMMADWLKEQGFIEPACRLVLQFGTEEQRVAAIAELEAWVKAEKERNLRLLEGDPEAPRPQGIIEFRE